VILKIVYEKKEEKSSRESVLQKKKE